MIYIWKCPFCGQITQRGGAFEWAQTRRVKGVAKTIYCHNACYNNARRGTRKISKEADANE